MKEINTYAVVDKNGVCYSFYALESEALKAKASVKDSIIVKLTGQMPEPKKPRRLAPALAKWHEKTRIELTLTLYESEEAARKDIGKCFISWPAVANAEGFYSVGDV